MKPEKTSAASQKEETDAGSVNIVKPLKPKDDWTHVNIYKGRSIEAEGNVTPPTTDYELKEIHAKIYHVDEAIPPEPPGNDNSVIKGWVSNASWRFTENRHPIPNANSNPSTEPCNPDNYLIVWALFVHKRTNEKKWRAAKKQFCGRH